MIALPASDGDHPRPYRSQPGLGSGHVGSGGRHRHVLSHDDSPGDHLASTRSWPSSGRGGHVSRGFPGTGGERVVSKEISVDHIPSLRGGEQGGAETPEERNDPIQVRLRPVQNNKDK